MNRWILYATGTALAGYGAYGLLTADRSAPLAWARFAAVVVIANDGLLAPVVIAGGALLVRALPGDSRAYVQSGLFISGSVTLLALPFLLGFGGSPDLPLGYGRGLLITLFVVWLGVGAVAAGRRWFTPPGSAP